MGSVLTRLVHDQPWGTYSSLPLDDDDDDICVRGPLTKQQQDAEDALFHARTALKKYNSNHPGPDFYPVEAKAACVGFRQDFWYHVGFSARTVRRDDEQQQQQEEERYFFAELRFDRRSRGHLHVESCIMLEKHPGSYRSRCALCPDRFKILHPSDAEFVCGKKGHRKKFFRERDMLGRPLRIRGISRKHCFADLSV